ncbi:MAG: hypothetical protein GX876_13445 [Bacteroidales bacterium]|nr:hypothetical protein [Bacteroidales bacterium]
MAEIGLLLQDYQDFLFFQRFGYFLKRRNLIHGNIILLIFRRLIFVMKLKHILKNIFRRVSVSIRSGPLKGKKWSIASGSKFINGNYEHYKTEAAAGLQGGFV